VLEIPEGVQENTFGCLSDPFEYMENGKDSCFRAKSKTFGAYTACFMMVRE
jgi:hypothetical protein